MLERVQTQAARFILPNYSRSSSICLIKTMLEFLNLSILRFISGLTLLHEVYYTPNFNRIPLHPPSHISPGTDHAVKVTVQIVPPVHIFMLLFHKR